jgi:hypothetical protein
MHYRAIDWVARFVYIIDMKTTTYIYANGQTTITVSDKPVLTKAQYAHACRVLRIAAQDAKSRKQAIDILRECAVKTQLMSAGGF